MPKLTSPMRRTLLASAASLATVSVLAPWSWAVDATSANTTVADQGPPPAPAEFLALSTLLIPDLRLDEHHGARLHAALLRQDAQFPVKTRALADVARKGPIADVELLADAVRHDASLSATLHTIVSAWYLGIVGDGVKAQVVAHDLALMQDVVRDEVVTPSYCTRAPGYWSAPPGLKSGAA